MVGPVAHQEMLLGSRRHRLHVLRWVYGGWLVAQVFFLFLQFWGEEQDRRTSLPSRAPYAPVSPSSVSAPIVVGRWFTETFLTQQLILLLLVTPAFVAGAVTDEKRRGTLQHLLTTDLESRHIVLGKLLGRVAQVALLAVAGLPLFFLFAGFAGMPPLALAVSLVSLVVPLLALGAVTVLASVWSRQTRDAVLGLYVLGGGAGLAVWALGGPLRYFDPRFVLEPAWGAAGPVDWPQLGRRLALSGLAWGGIGGVGLALAVWRLRPAYVRELESARPTATGLLGARRPPVDDQPVRWRERHVEGLAPVQALRRVPQRLALAVVFGVTTVVSLFILAGSYQGKPWKSLHDVYETVVGRQRLGTFDGAEVGFAVQGVGALLLASLIVGIRCSGAVTGERERKTWESLLLTPVSAREVVRGKLWGIMGASYAYLAAYAVPALALSAVAGPVACVLVLLCLGTTLLAMDFVGAAGIWCSVKSKTSWQSLLATLAWGYVAGTALFSLPTFLGGLVVYYVLLLALQTVEELFPVHLGGVARQVGAGFDPRVFFVAACAVLALCFHVMARQFLSWSQRWVADRERTRHWRDEPVYRRRKRPALAVGERGASAP